MFSPNIRTVTFSAAVFRLGHIFSGFTVIENFNLGLGANSESMDLIGNN